MTRDEFDAIEPGTPVTVYSFGVHHGTVRGKDPTITIQGRTVPTSGWLKVEIPGKPAPFNEWNGTFADVEIVPPGGAFKIVQCIEGVGFVTSMVEADNLAAWCAVRGFSIVGTNSNKRQRAELQGAPIIRGLLGPTWDGGVVRYEDSAANEILSR